ncbi:bifunctional precorrin-2 dehydrogenase/sirohydrochlorin ferrochelatase [Proteinivorax tanatarense]|uniref:precorrin-2 dehydrogenase n=1 Tax=Proteinivorax tanatarense TaxID=1260629 RepID=A0AAU7VJA9_9FIRM
MKKYYPVMLNIEGRKCTVVGGGAVALRKIKNLLNYGAQVKVVSPKILTEIENMAGEGRITLKKRPYQDGDLDENFLVYVATDDYAVNQRCYIEAQRVGAILNVVDIPKFCDFLVPAIHREGNLTVAISTDGKSPMLAKKIKEQLKQHYGPEYGDILSILGEIRKKALLEIQEIDKRKALFFHLVYGITFEGDKIEYEKEMWNSYNFFKEKCITKNK